MDGLRSRSCPPLHRRPPPQAPALTPKRPIVRILPCVPSVPCSLSPSGFCRLRNLLLPLPPVSRRLYRFSSRHDVTISFKPSRAVPPPLPPLLWLVRPLPWLAERPQRPDLLPSYFSRGSYKDFYHLNLCSFSFEHQK